MPYRNKDISASSIEVTAYNAVEAEPEDSDPLITKPTTEHDPEPLKPFLSSQHIHPSITLSSLAPSHYVLYAYLVHICGACRSLLDSIILTRLGEM
jgi:hypothetical protein